MIKPGLQSNWREEIFVLLQFCSPYKSLDLPISIMSFRLPSFRVSATANQVAVHKTRRFGDCVIAVYVHRNEGIFSPQSLLLLLPMARRIFAEGWVSGGEGWNPPLTHPSASLLLVIESPVVIYHTCVLCMCHGCRQA